MIVLDEEHYRWFLLEEDGQLYLDAVCSHGAVDYLFLLKLDEEEVARHIGPCAGSRPTRTRREKDRDR